MSYKAIGAQLDRSSQWAALAVATAERRERAGTKEAALDFDGSILALRKFTSTELLDAASTGPVLERAGAAVVP
jgi:hypothetical protein